jgi:hypothetical protein
MSHDDQYYRAKIISLLQAVNLFNRTVVEPYDPATEYSLGYVHAALQIYVLGLPDRYAPSLEIDNAQQFLIQRSLLQGPGDSRWSPAFSSALQQAFAPLGGTGELTYMQRLMFQRQGALLLSAYRRAVAQIPAAAKRALGLRTDMFADTFKWRVVLLDPSLISVYDTHAAVGANVPTVGFDYANRPEVREALVSDIGWSTRTGDEYGVSDLVNYIAGRLDSPHLPFRVVVFSRAAQ